MLPTPQLRPVDSSSTHCYTFSPFEGLHGFSIDGVDLHTAVLPDGWRNRLVKVQNATTAAPSGSPRFTGWCLDKEDHCVELITFREKDLNFVGALLDDHLVDLDEVRRRLNTVTAQHNAARDQADSWLGSREPG